MEALKGSFVLPRCLNRHLGNERRICGVSRLPCRRKSHLTCRALLGDAKSGWSGNLPINFRKLYSSNTRISEETRSRSEQKGDTATAATPFVPKLQALTGSEPVRFWGWVLAALAFTWAGWNLCRTLLRKGNSDATRPMKDPAESDTSGVAEYQGTLTSLYKTPKQPELVYWKANPEGEREQRSLAASGASLGTGTKHSNGNGNGNLNKYSSNGGNGNGNGKHDTGAVEAPEGPTSNGSNGHGNGKMQHFYIQQQPPIPDSFKMDSLGLPAQHQGLASKAVPPLPSSTQAPAPDTARDQQNAASIQPCRPDSQSTPATFDSRAQPAPDTSSEKGSANDFSQQQTASAADGAPDALSPMNGASLNGITPASKGFFANVKPRTTRMPQRVDWQSQPNIEGFFDVPSSPQPPARNAREPADNASTGASARQTALSDGTQARQSGPISNEGLSRRRGFFDAPQARDAPKAAGDVSTAAPVKTRGFFDAPQARDAPRSTASASNTAQNGTQSSAAAPQAKQGAAKPQPDVRTEASVRHQGFFATSSSKAANQPSSQGNQQDQPTLEGFFDAPSTKATSESEANVNTVNWHGFFGGSSGKATAKPDIEIDQAASSRKQGFFGKSPAHTHTKPSSSGSQWDQPSTRGFFDSAMPATKPAAGQDAEGSHASKSAPTPAASVTQGAPRQSSVKSFAGFFDIIDQNRSTRSPRDAAPSSKELARPEPPSGTSQLGRGMQSPRSAPNQPAGFFDAAAPMASPPSDSASSPQASSKAMQAPRTPAKPTVTRSASAQASQSAGSGSASRNPGSINGPVNGQKSSASQETPTLPSKPNGVYRRTQPSSANSAQDAAATREKLKPFLVAAGLAAMLAALAEIWLLIVAQQ